MLNSMNNDDGGGGGGGPDDGVGGGQPSIEELQAICPNEYAACTGDCVPQLESMLAGNPSADAAPGTPLFALVMCMSALEGGQNVGGGGPDDGVGGGQPSIEELQAICPNEYAACTGDCVPQLESRLAGNFVPVAEGTPLFALDVCMSTHEGGQDVGGGGPDDGVGGGQPTQASVCCRAMTPSCLACDAGLTVEEYCEDNPSTYGCTGPSAEPEGAWEADVIGDDGGGLDFEMIQLICGISGPPPSPPPRDAEPPEPEPPTVAPPVPAPPPPVVVEVTAVVLTAGSESHTAAVNAIAEAFALSASTEATSGAEAAAAEQPPVKVKSSATFAVHPDQLPEGSQARTDFSTSFQTSMADSFGGGNLIAPEKVIVNAIGLSTRRRLQTGTTTVDFHIETPLAVADHAASMMLTLASSNETLSVSIGNETLGASSMAAPVVTRAPDVNCTGTWSSCTSTCSDKMYLVSITASGAGATCFAGHGATSACAFGDGNCQAPPPPPPPPPQNGTSSSQNGTISSQPPPQSSAPEVVAPALTVTTVVPVVTVTYNDAELEAAKTEVLAAMASDGPVVSIAAEVTFEVLLPKPLFGSHSVSCLWPRCTLGSKLSARVHCRYPSMQSERIRPHALHSR